MICFQTTFFRFLHIFWNIIQTPFRQETLEMVNISYILIFFLYLYLLPFNLEFIWIWSELWCRVPTWQIQHTQNCWGRRRGQESQTASLLRRWRYWGHRKYKAEEARHQNRASRHSLGVHWSNWIVLWPEQPSCVYVAQQVAQLSWRYHRKSVHWF